MGMVDGTGLIVWEGGLFDPAGDLLPRIKWVFAQMRAEGFSITLNEAGRPYGVPGDVAVGRSGAGSAGTASGRSTVYYQWGRYLLYQDSNGRQGTPSAANPAAGPLASNHTRGLSVDTNTSNMARRKELMRAVGMIFDIPSETWHSTVYYPSSVDLSAWAGGNVTPVTPEEEDMTPEQDARLKNVENLVALISKQKPGAIWIKNIDKPGAFALLTEGEVRYPKSSEEIETINRVMGGAPGVKREADPLNNQEYTDIIAFWSR